MRPPPNEAMSKMATGDERPGTAPHHHLHQIIGGGGYEEISARPATSLGVGLRGLRQASAEAAKGDAHEFLGVGRQSAFLLREEDHDEDAVNAALIPHLCKFRADRTRQVYNKMFRPAAVPPATPPTASQLRAIQEQLFGPPNFVAAAERHRACASRPASTLGFQSGPPSREVSRELSNASLTWDAFRPSSSPVVGTPGLRYAAQVVRKRREEDYSGQDIPIAVSMLSPAPLIAAQLPLGSSDSRPGTADALRGSSLSRGRGQQQQQKVRGERSVQGPGGQLYDLLALSEPSWEVVGRGKRGLDKNLLSPQESRERIRGDAVSPQGSRGTLRSAGRVWNPM